METPSSPAVQRLRSSGVAAAASLADLEAVAERFAVAITPASAALIDATDPLDPIGLQFIPDARELLTSAEERSDPIGDEVHSPTPGVVRRYPDRALLMPTTRCASYCRFCFRRETVGRGEAGVLPKADLDAAFAYLASEKDIWEVILTGGDPLILSPRRLGDILVRLGEIPHIRIVRIHTRTPAVAPERITPALIRALKSGGQTVYVALHANHPRELTPEVRRACARIVDAGVPMLSQTVLLRQVNDDPETLALLMRSFVEMRIRPYYLHHGDLAPGTAHLRTNLAESQRLARSLRGRLSGLCQPTLILDIPGGHGKVPAAPAYVRTCSSGTFEVEDPKGRVHAYPPKNQAIG